MENGEKAQNMSYQEYRQNFRRRMNFRQLNLNAVGEDFIPRRKNAQIKVIQKFIGKLKVQNKNYQAITAQLDTLNLSKYLQEISNIIASSIIEKQILFYVEVSTKLNTEYEGFPAILIKDLIKHFNLTFQSAEENRLKLKAILLFTTELFVSGFAFSYKQLIQMIKKTFKSGKNKKFNYPSEVENKLFLYYYSSSIFAPFLLNFVEVFTRKVPKWVTVWKNQEKETEKYPEALPTKMKDQLTGFFMKYYNECFTLLEEICQIIKQYEESLKESLKLNGQFNKEKQKNYKELIDKFVETKRNLIIISEGLGENLQLNKIQMILIDPAQILAKYIGKTDVQIFQDEFQKEIYENLPDLVKKQNKECGEEQYIKFKQKLQNCKNVNDCNEIVMSFAQINNKKNRKNLVKDVLQYRREYQLVTPYLCRVIAIVQMNFKDIGDVVNELLLPDFEKLKQAASNTFVVNDKKSRLLKYMCEFTKFKVIEAEKMMNCIQSIIDDLNGYNIEMIVAALQNVGLFLRLSTNSSNRFTFLLNKFQNVIKKRSFPLFTTSQLNNSINLLKPRNQAPKQSEKDLCPVEREAKKIMSLDIVQESDQIIKQIDLLIKKQDGSKYLQYYLLKSIQEYDFLGNYHYAYLLDELNYHQLSNYITDKTIQFIQKNILGYENQKVMIWSRFIAELYKYKIIERPLLYSIMEDLMNLKENQLGVINAICTILDACVDYLDSKKMLRKNERFMFFVKFKKYIKHCNYIPMLQEFQLIDIFKEFQPDLVEISMSILDNFLQSADKKMKTQNKEVLFPEQLDKYLRKKKLKKNETKSENKDSREGKEKEKDQTLTSHISLQEVKAFDKELTSIVDTNIKDYSSRIAKSVFLEKNFDKKKEKKKDVPCITVIGRKGNKFVRKDVNKPKPDL